MTPRLFRPICYKFYGQLDTLRPAPIQRRPRISAINLAFALALLALAAPVLYLLLTGDYPGARWMYGLAEDHPLVTSLLAVARTLR